MKEKENIKDIYLLSPMQEGILFHTLSDTGSPVYFEQASMRINGGLDVPIVRKSLNLLLERYDILRTVFIHEGQDRPLQVVLEHREIDFHYENIQDVEEKENFVKEFIQNDRRRYFNLQKDVLIRVSILQLGKFEFELIWSHHHILMDGWCRGILISEFFEIYNCLLEGRSHQLPETIPYRTFIKWLERQDEDVSKNHWKKYLSGYEGGVSIRAMSTGSNHADEDNYQARSELFLLETEPGDLNQLSANNKVTLNTVIQALWGILLGRYNNKKDVVFGAVVSGRPPEIEGVESMVGLFINTIPVRICFEEKIKFNRLLQRVKEQAIENEPHHYYPLAKIQAETFHKKELIDHILVFENFPFASQLDGALEGNTGSGRDEPFQIGDNQIFTQTNYHFNMIISPGTPMGIRLEYNGNLYRREFVIRIVNQFKVFLTQVLNNDSVYVDDLTLLTEPEKKQILYDFNDTAVEYQTNKTINEMFEEQVLRTPDLPAIAGIIQQGRNGALSHITYEELNRKANQLARVLQSRGVLPDCIVALQTERSPEMIIGILAILKTGGAYFPVDSHVPRSRAEFMIADSSCQWLVTQKHLLDESNMLPQYFFPGNIILLDDRTHDTGDSSNVQADAGPGHLAYVIYTSGTTGKPKGVMMEHRNVINLVLGLHEKIYRRYNMNLRICLLAPYVFDASVKQIFASLLLGHTLYLAPEGTRLDGEELLQYYKRHQVDISDGTPGHLRLLLDNLTKKGFNSIGVKQFIIGGEALSKNIIREFWDHFPDEPGIINIYGPTECTVDSAIFPVTREDMQQRHSIPIGTPMPNYKVYILDETDRLQPVGIPGELCISGAGTARGYLNRVELTDNRFIENPFDKGQKLYRTGDLCRWLEDGNIEFLGRVDRQVKIRGFRIELGEIENQLLNQKAVREAAVITWSHSDGDSDPNSPDPGMEKYLCAYFVSDKELETGELKKSLADNLPDYMIPAFFMQVDKIPLTTNGKIDRNALPKPELSISGVYWPPRNDTERELAAIWSETLEIEKSKIGIDNNFFDLGGHSLKATTLASKIHKAFKVKLPIKHVFSFPTIRGLADSIKNLSREKFALIEPVEKKEYYPLSSSQNRIFFLQMLAPDSTAYNILHTVLFEGHLEIAKLEKTIKTLINRHEILRTTFEIKEDIPVQRIYHHVDFAIEFYNLLDDGSVSREDGAEKGIITKFVKPFKLSELPLLKVGLIRLEEKKHIFLLDMHHIITDGISQNILVQDFMAIYAGLELPPPKIQFKEFAEWQNSATEKEAVKKQEEYWLNIFAGDLPQLKLPIDYPRPEKFNYKGESSTFDLDKNKSGSLDDLARREEVTMHILLMAFYTVLISKISMEDDIVVGMAIAGRNHADLESMIGMFLNMLAIRSHPNGNKTFKEFLAEFKNQILSAYDNQDYQFEDLVEKVVVERDVNRNPLFNVAFGFQNLESAAIEIPGLKVKPYQFEMKKTSKIDLLMVASEWEDRLLFTVEYNSTLFKKETIDRFIQYFERIVGAVIETPGIKLEEIQIISEKEKDWILSRKKENEESLRIDFDF